MVGGASERGEENEYVEEEISKVQNEQKLKLLYAPKQTALPIKIDPEECKTQTFVITAYCPCRKCCGKWANGITSTGVKAQAGRTIAVDPRKIPYGTKVIIDGHTYVAEDCGGAIKGNRIDIFFNSHSEALQWGRRTKQVTILN